MSGRILSKRLNARIPKHDAYRLTAHYLTLSSLDYLAAYNRTESAGPTGQPFFQPGPPGPGTAANPRRSGPTGRQFPTSNCRPVGPKEFYWSVPRASGPGWANCWPVGPEDLLHRKSTPCSNRPDMGSWLWQGSASHGRLRSCGGITSCAPQAALALPYGRSPSGASRAISPPSRRETVRNLQLASCLRQIALEPPVPGTASAFSPRRDKCRS